MTYSDGRTQEYTDSYKHEVAWDSKRKEFCETRTKMIVRLFEGLYS